MAKKIEFDKGTGAKSEADTKDHGLPVHRQAMAKILHAVRYTDKGTNVYIVSEYL